MGNSQLAQAIERPSDMKFVMDYGSVMAVAGEQIGTAGLSGFEFSEQDVDGDAGRFREG